MNIGKREVVQRQRVLTGTAQKFYEVRTCLIERRRLIPSLSIPARERKTEIELKSLILAQIERWRHALHMQVERQHGELAL